MMSATQIDINGMTCQHCVNAVVRALDAVPGVESVQVQLTPGRATVSGSADAASLLRAIERAGYGAALAAANG